MVAVLGALLAIGLLGIGRLIRGLPLLPTALTRGPRRRGRSLTTADRRIVPAGMGVAVVVLVVSRNPVVAVIVGAVVVLWPMVAGGGKAERAALAKLEALAEWTEALRDLAQKGAGLESVIPKTVDTASDVLVAPLRLLSRRLSVKVPLPEALSRFADEVDDASADMVVAALALAARQRKGRLSDVLTALSRSLRDELEQRTRVMRERNGVRREAAQVAALTAVLVLAAGLFSPRGLPEGGGTAARLLPLVLAVAYLFVFSRVRRLAEPEPEPRFLSGASDVLEAASYRPRTVNL
jgi:tight adherence protein B